MKRDMDLVRKILFHIEASEGGNINLDIPEHSQNAIHRHVELMKDKGLVDATIVPSSDGPEHKILDCEVRRLTWEGHDFLDAARCDTLWEQAKKQCREKTGGLAFDLLKACLIQLANRALGLEE